jgi:hypothetical protein
MAIKEDSKMAIRGRKQKVCFLKETLREMLEIHLAGKNTKKRQNSDTSTLSAHTYPPYHVKWRNQEGSHAARCQLYPAWETTR